MDNKQIIKTRNSGPVPFLCPNIKFMSNKPSMNSYEKIKSLKKCFNENSHSFVSKETKLRKYFGYCSYNYKDKIQKITISDDLTFLIILYSYYCIDIYSIPDNNIMHQFTEKVKILDMIVVSEKSLVFYITDKVIKCWNYREGSVEDIFHSSYVKIVTMNASPDGLYVAGGSYSGKIFLINCKEKQFVILKSHLCSIEDIEFTQDSQYFISSGGDIEKYSDCSIRIWSVKKKSLISVLAGHPLSVYSIKIHYSGRFFLSLSRDTTLRLWDLEKAIINNPNIDSLETKNIHNTKTFDFYSETHLKISEILKKHPKTHFLDINILKQSIQNYVLDVLMNCKDHNEINRLCLDIDMIHMAFFPIFLHAFFVNDSIFVINMNDSKVTCYDMISMIKQKSFNIDISPFNEINIVKEKMVFAGENNEVSIVDCITEDCRKIVFPGSLFELHHLGLENLSFLISILRQKNTDVYKMIIWD